MYFTVSDTLMQYMIINLISLGTFYPFHLFLLSHWLRTISYYNNRLNNANISLNQREKEILRKYHKTDITRYTKIL